MSISAWGSWAHLCLGGRPVCTHPASMQIAAAHSAFCSAGKSPSDPPMSPPPPVMVNRFHCRAPPATLGRRPHVFYLWKMPATALQKWCSGRAATASQALLGVPSSGSSEVDVALNGSLNPFSAIISVFPDDFAAVEHGHLDGARTRTKWALEQSFPDFGCPPRFCTEQSSYANRTPSAADGTLVARSSSVLLRSQVQGVGILLARPVPHAQT